MRCQLPIQAHQSISDVRNEIECPDSFDNGQGNEDVLENSQKQEKLCGLTLSSRDRFCTTQDHVSYSLSNTL